MRDDEGNGDWEASTRHVALIIDLRQLLDMTRSLGAMLSFGLLGGTITREERMNRCLWHDGHRPESTFFLSFSTPTGSIDRVPIQHSVLSGYSARTELLYSYHHTRGRPGGCPFHSQTRSIRDLCMRASPIVARDPTSDEYMRL